MKSLQNGISTFGWPRLISGRHSIVWSTTLCGLQRPPLTGRPTLVRIGSATAARADALDAAAPFVLPFVLTNAKEQLVVSCDPLLADGALGALGGALGTGALVIEDDAAFEARVARDEPWNVVRAGERAWRALAPPEAFPLVGHFVTLLFPFGHVKSTKSDDREFIAAFAASPKWLRAAH